MMSRIYSTLVSLLELFSLLFTSGCEPSLDSSELGSGPCLYDEESDDCLDQQAKDQGQPEVEHRVGKLKAFRVLVRALKSNQLQRFIKYTPWLGESAKLTLRRYSFAIAEAVAPWNTWWRRGSSLFVVPCLKSFGEGRHALTLSRSLTGFRGLYSTSFCRWLTGKPTRALLTKRVVLERECEIGLCGVHFFQKQC